MDSNQFKAAAQSAVAHITDYYDTIEDRRVMSAVEPGYLRKILPSSAPQEGESWETIQKDIDTKILPGLTHWQSPNFMAFFPSNSSFPGILGELYSAAFQGAMFNWICGPAATELETIVLDWLAEAFALPECFHSHTVGGGVIQGSASEAIVTVMVAARDRHLRQSVAHITDDHEREEAFFSRRSRLVALGSEMAHSSTQKAAQIAGVRFRVVPVRKENQYAMNAKDLEQVIQKCKDEGLEPFYLTATLGMPSDEAAGYIQLLTRIPGTTSTCAIDDMESIAAVADRHPLLWVHVDAAYVGAALICSEYQRHASFLGHFESYNMNLHKWLLVNFDASCLWVKNRRHLTDALSITPSYLRNEHSDSGLVTDYRDWQIPLGRRFRSLKIWFVLRTYGIRGLQAHIRNHITYGDQFARLIRSRADLFEILVEPQFALTVFRMHSQHSTSSLGQEAALQQANERTKELYETVNREGRIMITSSMVHDAYVIRVVSGTPRTEERHLLCAFEILVEVAERILVDKGDQVNGIKED